MTPLLSVKRIGKSFAAQSPSVVDNVSFEVKSGEIFGLLGPSGCGKTTTLRLIAGFEHVDTGEIYLDNRPIETPSVHISPALRKIGFVFQDCALFPHLNVLDNVSFGLKKLRGKARRDRSMEVLEMVGLAEFQSRRPHDLSGGEQRRVALARSIAPSPEIILLDEPFSGLDDPLRQSTREEVRKLLKKAGTSAILVTHDQDEALSLADRVGVMRRGKLEQTGTPEDLYHRPNTPFVASFLGKTNLVSGQGEGDWAETSLGRVKLDCYVRGKLLLSVRPEHLIMTKTDSAQTGRGAGCIVAREFKGHDLTFTVQFAGSDYFVQTDYRSTCKVGEWVRLATVEPAVVLEQHVKGKPLGSETANGVSVS